MSKNRRTLSVSAATYARLTEYSRTSGEPLSRLIERLLRAAISGDGQLGTDNPTHTSASSSVGGGHARSGESPGTGNVAEPQIDPPGSAASIARPLGATQ